ncbi:MAG: hypothetical protein LC642_08720, partial [Verrucomicrobiaceae bacterium]|nr:hypothetical protein [Verrucomicrobiaceae bacterium]
MPLFFAGTRPGASRLAFGPAMNEPKPERRFHGVGVSPGIARGASFVVRHQDEEPPIRRIEERDLPGEIARFETALIATRAQILEMQRRIAESIGTKDASIF